MKTVHHGISGFFRVKSMEILCEVVEVVQLCANLARNERLGQEAYCAKTSINTVNIAHTWKDVEFNIVNAQKLPCSACGPSMNILLSLSYR